MRKHIGIGLLLVLLGFSLSSWAQFDTLSFSVPGGFYDEVFSLELQCGNPDYHIRFTTNGNEPTRHSQRYSEPLTLDERMYSKSNIYTVRNCPEDQFQVADSIERCIVIRAAVFDESDNCVSTVWVATCTVCLPCRFVSIHLIYLIIIKESLSKEHVIGLIGLIGRAIIISMVESGSFQPISSFMNSTTQGSTSLADFVLMAAMAEGFNKRP